MAVQRSTFTQLELRDRVRGDVGLRSSSLVTDADIDRWAQRYQRRVAFITHWYRLTGAARAVTAGTGEYDLHQSTPNTVVAIEEVRHDNLPLSHISVRELERLHWNWRDSDTGTPRYYYLRGTTAFGLWPVPATTDSDALVVIYAALPANPTGDTDFYYIPTALEESLECECRYRAALKDASGEGRDRIAAYAREREEWEMRLQQYVSEMSEGESLVIGADNDPAWANVYDPIRWGTVT